jgi:hypothetical protein
MRKLNHWLLYWLDPVFRRLARAKRRRGPDDKVAAGETVVAVIRGPNHRRVIK